MQCEVVPTVLNSYTYKFPFLPISVPNVLILFECIGLCFDYQILCAHCIHIQNHQKKFKRIYCRVGLDFYFYLMCSQMLSLTSYGLMYGSNYINKWNYPYRFSWKKVVQFPLNVYCTSSCVRLEGQGLITRHWPGLFHRQLQPPPCTVSQSGAPTHLPLFLLFC